MPLKKPDLDFTVCICIEVIMKHTHRHIDVDFSLRTPLCINIHTQARLVASIGHTGDLDLRCPALVRPGRSPAPHLVFLKTPQTCQKMIARVMSCLVFSHIQISHELKKILS